MKQLFHPIQLLKPILQKLLNKQTLLPILHPLISLVSQMGEWRCMKPAMVGSMLMNGGMGGMGMGGMGMGGLGMGGLNRPGYGGYGNGFNQPGYGQNNFIPPGYGQNGLANQFNQGGYYQYPAGPLNGTSMRLEKDHPTTGNLIRPDTGQAIIPGRDSRYFPVDLLRDSKTGTLYDAQTGQAIILGNGTNPLIPQPNNRPIQPTAQII